MSEYHIAALSRKTNDLIIAQLETSLTVKQIKKTVKENPERIYPSIHLTGKYDITIARQHDSSLYTIDSFIATYPHR